MTRRDLLFTVEFFRPENSRSIDDFFAGKFYDEAGRPTRLTDFVHLFDPALAADMLNVWDTGSPSALSGPFTEMVTRLGFWDGAGYSEATAPFLATIDRITHQELGWHGRTLDTLLGCGVPFEYGWPLVAAGLRAADVVEAWVSGVPAEYAGTVFSCPAG